MLFHCQRHQWISKRCLIFFFLLLESPGRQQDDGWWRGWVPSPLPKKKEEVVYLLVLEEVVLLEVDEREKSDDDCSRLSNSERKRVISSSILRISESKRSRIELNSESRTLKSPSLMGIMFLPAIFVIPVQTNTHTKNEYMQWRQVITGRWRSTVSQKEMGKRKDERINPTRQRASPAGKKIPAEFVKEKQHPNVFLRQGYVTIKGVEKRHGRANTRGGRRNPLPIQISTTCFVCLFSC